MQTNPSSGDDAGTSAPPARNASTPAYAPPSAYPVERRRHRSSRGVFLVAPLLAAVVAIVALRSSARAREDDAAVRVARALAPVAAAPTRGTATATPAAARYGVAWDQPPWAEVDRAAGSLPPHATAFRLGARVMELELAFIARDTAAINRSAATVVRLASSLAGGAPSAARVEAVAARAATSTTSDRAEVARELRTLGGSDEWFDAGAWTDAARIAATSGRADFFASDGAALAELRRLLGALDALPTGARTELATARERLHAIAARTGPAHAELPAIAAALDSTMREVGG